jgi:hypothetical protein
LIVNALVCAAARRVHSTLVQSASPFLSARCCGFTLYVAHAEKKEGLRTYLRACQVHVGEFRKSKAVVFQYVAWFGLVWFGLVWFGLVWFGLVLV